MNRGLALSVSLHVAVFVAVLLGPTPKAFEMWDPSDAVAVDLVAAPAKQSPVPPRERPAAPAPESDAPSEEIEPEKNDEPVADPGPPPVKPVTRSRPKLKVIRPFAQKAGEEEEAGGNWRERLANRLDSLSEASDAPESKDEVGPTASLPTTTADVEVSDFPYAWYLNVVRTRITDAWDPPGERLIAGRTNQVLVRFQLHRDGSVTDVVVEGASGTPGLDASARRAVQQAQPFSPLPDNYAGDVLAVGVRFTVGGS